MSNVQVRIAVIVTGPNDRAVDEVLRALAAQHDPVAGLFVNVRETSRELVG